MRVLIGVPAAVLLDVWEHGREAWPGERALALLEVAETGSSQEALADWTVGRRDAALLAFRERLFGPTVSALADCPRCGELLEMEFPVSGLASTLPREELARRDGVFELEADGHRIRYRLPTAGDLAELRRHDGAAVWLLERCVVGVDPIATVAASPSLGGSAGSEATECATSTDREGRVRVRDIRPDAREALEAAVARTAADFDPQADIELELTCPACAEEWRTPFDITAFLWRELESWAMRTLWETHLLARAYGWSEADILALGSWRRQHYIDLIADAAP
ncbi:hypothetical protein ACFT30_08395 [Microbacterium ureisolvens]|uniref:hypothetical protein n=1 Tax=Microbacterium ureisolvens TaxID=2781186 RepID=UPI003637C732